MPRRVRSLEGAAAFVEEAGIALLFPRADLVLPSLSEAVCGPGELEWAVRDDEGSFVEFSPEFEKLWRWKDELPERRLVCVGKHVARAVTAVSPRLLPALYALTGRPGAPQDFRDAELSPLELEIAEAVLDNGPCSGPEIRRLVGAEKKAADRAVELLQRRLVLTNAGAVEQEQGWPAISQDVLARRWKRNLRKLPPADKARHTLAERVLRAVGELSAADLGAVLRWRLREARAVLGELVDAGKATVREEDGIELWRPRGSRGR